MEGRRLVVAGRPRVGLLRVVRGEFSVASRADLKYWKAWMFTDRLQYSDYTFLLNPTPPLTRSAFNGMCASHFSTVSVQYYDNSSYVSDMVVTSSKWPPASATAYAHPVDGVSLDDLQEQKVRHYSSALEWTSDDSRLMIPAVRRWEPVSDNYWCYSGSIRLSLGSCPWDKSLFMPSSQ